MLVERKLNDSFVVWMFTIWIGSFKVSQCFCFGIDLA
jgi:hypothetical protein